MSKVIAFYGAPGSGKTTIALKTAMEMYHCTKDGNIIFLSPDLAVPSIGLLFPNYDPDDVFTLASVLDNTEMSAEILLRNAVTLKNMQNFLCFGFKSGDTKYSFPQPDEKKIEELYASLQDLAEYVFVDCTNDNADIISLKAKSDADIAVRIIQPLPKGVSWYASNSTSPRKEGETLFNVVNVNERDLFVPTEEVCTKLNSIAALVPYSLPAKKQMLDGDLYSDLADKAFNKKINQLMKKIIGE